MAESTSTQPSTSTFAENGNRVITKVLECPRCKITYKEATEKEVFLKHLITKHFQYVPSRYPSYCYHCRPVGSAVKLINLKSKVKTKLRVKRKFKLN